MAVKPGGWCYGILRFALDGLGLIFGVVVKWTYSILAFKLVWFTLRHLLAKILDGYYRQLLESSLLGAF
jgi:hypothetical protein